MASISRWLGALFLAGVGLSAQADTRVFITGEWPPYTGIAEPQGGSVTAVVRAALAAEGDQLRVGFFPWYRVRDMLVQNANADGIFPNYYSAERARLYYFSDSIGESPLGLAELHAAPLPWASLADLRGRRIGLVKTYVNSPVLDQMVRSGSIIAVEATSDAENLHNLLAGKVDAAVIDRNVYAYLLSRDESLREAADRLELGPGVLAVQAMYVCFPRTQQGRRLRDRFNRGLQQLHLPAAPPH